MMQLEGKRGVVLGVANERSIAWAIAQAAHQAGARLAFNYQNERLERDVRALAGQLDGSCCFPCDLSYDEQIDAFFGRVAEAFEGKLDFLVHSIAFARREDLMGRYLDTPRDGFRLALEVSVYSLGAALKRAMPLLRAAGGGSVVTLSYFGAEKVIPNYNVMGVAKAALEASVRYLAADVGPEGVRVNAISAGAIRTTAARAISGFGDMLNLAEHRAPLRRNINPAEVAQAAIFLASPAGGGITGEVIYVDAGYNIMGL
jgi:enoyl-[acyl-carrier protein] reductase I